MQQSGRIAWVAGASGMVGTELLRVLAASGDYARVYALTRRPLTFDLPQVANRILRFESLETELGGVGCDDAYCCLGSTMARAGSQQAFRAVDHDLVLRYARCALAAGAKTFTVLSSVGASPAATNFYLRTKGECELALEALGFRSLFIVQPGLLLGARRESRPLEALGRALMPLVNPLLVGRHARWRGMSAREVALAMRAAVHSQRLGAHRLTWPALHALATTGRMPARM
jgi:uncharacterized protein YbjT (DUF2867 family)